MKYYKNTKFTKAIGSTGFITIIAFVLVAVGAIGWFALSRKNPVTETPQDNTQQAYPNIDNSYNDIDTSEQHAETPSTDVDDTVNDVPYSDIESSAAQPEPQLPTFVLPVTGNISKGYSDTALQYSATYGDMRLHTGVDILCEKNSNVKSAGSGTVKSVVDDTNLGKIVTIDYDNKICVKYCGMGSINVKENDKVAVGDIIGTTGDIPSECADNPHIHIEVLVDGESVSPLEALGLK